MVFDLSVVSVKVPEWVKEKMQKYGKYVNWAEEIRRMIIAKIEEIERKEAIERAVKILSSLSLTPKGVAKNLVRENRDSH